MKKIFQVSRSALITTTLCLGLMLGMTSAAFAKTTIILTHNLPIDHLYNTLYQTFSTKLNEISNNNFEFQYHPASSLGDWTSLMDQNIGGATHINFGPPASELDPRLDLANFGFVVNDWEQAKKAYGPGSAAEQIYMNIFKDLGLTCLGTVPTGFTGFLVRKGLEVPKNIPADAKGFKMRVPPFRMAITRYKALGFSVVPMPYTEVYTALQTGAIDGMAYVPPHEITPFLDVLEAYVYSREHFEHNYFLVNTEWLNSLKPEEQKQIREAATYALNSIWAEVEKQSIGWLDSLRTKGLKIYEMDAEQRKGYAEIVLKTERPFVEKLLGKDTVDALFKAAQ